MAVNWGPVGQQLAALQHGTGDVTEKRLGDLAALDLKLQKAKGRRDILDKLSANGYSPDEAALGAALIQGESGSDFSAMELGLGRRQERGFRQQAVDAYGTGGAAAANQFRAGLGSAPIEVTKITAGQAYNPTVAPGSQDIVITDIGDSVIGANEARARASDKQGEASLIRANRAPASRSGGGKAASAPKISDVDRYRLKGIQEKKKDAAYALDAARGVDKDEAQAALALLERQEAAILGKYDEGSIGNAALPDVDTDVADDEAGIGNAMDSPDTWYNDPATGEQKRVGAPAARPAVPANAVKALWADPSLKEQFAAKYGPAAADAALARRPR